VGRERQVRAQAGYQGPGRPGAPGAIAFAFYVQQMKFKDMYHRIILLILALTGLSINCNAANQCELAWVDFSNQPSIPDSFTLNCKMDSSDFQIKGIGWSGTNSKILKFLGKPKKKTIDTCYTEDSIIYYKQRWIYDGFHLITNVGNVTPYCDDGTVTLVITSNKIKTKRGVTVGDSLSKVFSIYGRPDQTESQYHEFIYFGADSTYFLLFYHNDKTVERISMGFYQWY
jgi:hypothetical protein